MKAASEERRAENDQRVKGLAFARPLHATINRALRFSRIQNAGNFTKKSRES